MQVIKVKDIMVRDVQIVSPDTPVLNAARKMREYDIGCLLVCEKRRCVGMVTDRDIVFQVVETERDPKTTPVKNVMSLDVYSCKESDDLSVAAEVMKKNQVWRILVLGENGEILGICSVGDFALYSKNLELTGEIMCEVARHGW